MAGIQVTRIRVTTTSGAGTAAETACTELDLPEDVGVGEREKTTTASAFLSCVSASARNDERFDWSIKSKIGTVFTIVSYKHKLKLLYRFLVENTV